MTSAAEATQLIAAHMPQWQVETVALEAAPDRVLARDIPAERDIPAFDRVTMDGIAIAYAEYARGTRRFAIGGVQAAGVAAVALPDPGSCMRVMTGAVLPHGADTVIPVERISLDEATATIAGDASVTRGQFIHRCGSDRKRGSRVLEAGMRIGPAEMAVLASSGVATVEVACLPRVAVISTGDELVGVADPVEPFQIRSSNEYAIDAALRRHHCGSVTRLRLRDDPDKLLAAVTRAHDEHDALILSGGVSMGDFDFVPATLERLGVRLVFHRIRQKPGRPMWFGTSSGNKPVFALPGNPVSTLVCLCRYVVPALRDAMRLTDSRQELVRLAADATDGPEDWTCFVPVTLSWDASGTASAQPRRINTSGDFCSLAGTDGIVELAPGTETRRAGAVVPLYRW